MILVSFSTTVKEAKRQRKEAQLIKQLEKQKRQEAAERERLEEQQKKNGSVIIFSRVAVCSRTPVNSLM